MTIPTNLPATTNNEYVDAEVLDEPFVEIEDYVASEREHQ